MPVEANVKLFLVCLLNYCSY